jgi:transcriptional regulator with XRE-family HTH domain
MTDTGNAIASVRRFHRLTQGELAQKAGLTEAAIYSIEAGRRKPRIDTLTKIATALGVPTSDLIEDYSDIRPDRCWWPTPKATFPPNLAAYFESIGRGVE